MRTNKCITQKEKAKGKLESAYLKLTPGQAMKIVTISGLEELQRLEPRELRTQYYSNNV